MNISKISINGRDGLEAACMVDHLDAYKAKEILEAIKQLPPIKKLFSNSPAAEPFELEGGQRLIVRSIKRFGKNYIQIFLPQQQASYAHSPKDAKDVYMAIGKPPSLVFSYKGFNYELHLGPPNKNLCK